MRDGLAASMAVLICCAAWAESFTDRLEKAHGLLREGKPDEAMSVYRDLQTDEPESDVLYYSIGCAEYEKGRADAEAGATEGAIESLKEAADSFQRVAISPNAAIRRGARYNLANSKAQLAKQAAGAGQSDAAGKGFEEAIRAYDECLRLYPDNENARNNRDHVRYLLKKMLQNPPAPQEQSKDEQNQKQDGQNQSGSQDQQNKDEAVPPKQDQQQGEKKQDQQRSEDEQKHGRQSPEETQAQQQQDQSSRPGQEQALTSEALPPDEAGNAKEGDMDKRNLEAILQSLEELDQRELYDTKARRPGTVRGEWW